MLQGLGVAGGGGGGGGAGEDANMTREEQELADLATRLLPPRCVCVCVVVVLLRVLMSLVCIVGWV